MVGGRKSSHGNGLRTCVAMGYLVILFRSGCGAWRWGIGCVMQRVKLDRIDRQILSDLQTDGRMTNVELASRAGISAPPCLRRVRALEEAGYIKGYRALLDEKKLGYEVTVFAMVHLT